MNNKHFGRCVIIILVLVSREWAKEEASVCVCAGVESYSRKDSQLVGTGWNQEEAMLILLLLLARIQGMLCAIKKRTKALTFSHTYL